MATNIATGIIDVQLMGLPDVKRQLDGIPRLLDNVAQSAINIQRNMDRVFKDANKEFAAFQQKWSGFTTSQLQQLGVKAPMSGAEAVQAEFRQSMRERVDVGYEAETGEKALKILDIEERMLQSLMAQDRAAGKMNDALERVYETELKRVHLSKAAVDRESKSFKGILGQEFGIFQDQATQRKETEDLKKMKDGLDEFRKSTEADTKVGKAFTAQMEAQIATNEKYISQKQEIASRMSDVGKRRDNLRAKQASTVSLTKSEEKELVRLNGEMNRLRQKMGSVTVQQNSFNSELHEFGTGSRAANFRMQQLSFAAQDFVQVVGQTGVAGALHASANNMAMFVQTMDFASPKMAAWGAFGVTAGMMALSTWLNTARKESDELRDSIGSLGKELDRRLSNIRIRVSGGGAKEASRDLSDKLSELSLKSQYNQEALQKEANSLLRSGVGTWDHMVGLFSASRDRANAEMVDSLNAYSRGDMSAEGLMKVFDRLGMLTSQQEDSYRESAENAKDIANEFMKARKLARETALESIRLTESRGTGFGATPATRLSEKLSDLGMEYNGTDLISRGKEAERLRGISDAVESFSPQMMTEFEKRSGDFSGARDNLIAEFNALKTKLQGMGAREGDLRLLQDKYMFTFQDLDQAQRSRAEAEKSYGAALADMHRQGDVSEINKIRQEYLREADALVSRMHSLFPMADPADLFVEETGIRNSAADRAEEAIGKYQKELEKSVAEEANWNNRFASQRNSLIESHKKKADEIRKSELGPKKRQRLLDQLFRSGEQQMSNIDIMEDKAKLDSQFSGRFGGESDLQSQELAITRQLMDALASIQSDPYLTGAQKSERAAIAKESATEAKFAARENFNKIGLSDPKSLHKQIQMSLKKPKSEKLAEDQLKELQTANEINQDLLDAISALGIGT